MSQETTKEKKELSGWKKVERRTKIGNWIATILIVLAFFNYIQFATVIPVLTLMVTYICFANQVDDKSESTERVIILGALLALFTIVYFSQQYSKIEKRENLESATTNIMRYCNSQINSNSDLTSLNIDKKVQEELIDCERIYQELGELWDTNYGAVSDYDDQIYGLF